MCLRRTKFNWKHKEVQCEYFKLWTCVVRAVGMRLLEDWDLCLSVRRTTDHVPLVLHGHLLPGLLRVTEPGGRPPIHGVPQGNGGPPGVEDRTPPGGDQEVSGPITFTSKGRVHKDLLVFRTSSRTPGTRSIVYLYIILWFIIISTVILQTEDNRLMITDWG